MNKYQILVIYQGVYMKNIFRYSGIFVLSISLIMFSLGSIPQTYAGSPSNTITSTMVLSITCGLGITGTADFGLVSTGDTVFNSDVTISNSGTATAEISANVGQALVKSPLAGGYAGSTDQTTHIAPHDITLQIDSQGRVPLEDSSSDVLIGGLVNTDPGTLEIGITLNPINLPIVDQVWVATYELTVSDCHL